MIAPKGANSVSGVWGNLKFLVGFKFWATLIVFAVGVVVGGFFLCGTIGGY